MPASTRITSSSSRDWTGRRSDVVDVPRLQIPRADGGSVPLRHLGLLAPEDIVTTRLWAYRSPAAPKRIDYDRKLWTRLKKENAALRVHARRRPRFGADHLLR